VKVDVIRRTYSDAMGRTTVVLSLILALYFIGMYIVFMFMSYRTFALYYSLGCIKAA